MLSILGIFLSPILSLRLFTSVIWMLSLFQSRFKLKDMLSLKKAANLCRCFLLNHMGDSKSSTRPLMRGLSNSPFSIYWMGGITSKCWWWEMQSYPLCSLLKLSSSSWQARMITLSRRRRYFCSITPTHMRLSFRSLVRKILCSLSPLRMEKYNPMESKMFALSIAFLELLKEVEGFKKL